MHVSCKARRTGLTVVTSLALTMVRSQITGRGFFWGSIEVFLGAWLAHGIGLLILCMATTLAVDRWRGFFVGTDVRPPSHIDIQVIVSVAILIVAVAALVIFQWPITGLDDEAL